MQPARDLRCCVCVCVCCLSSFSGLCVRGAELRRRPPPPQQQQQQHAPSLRARVYCVRRLIVGGNAAHFISGATSGDGWLGCQRQLIRCGLGAAAAATTKTHHHGKTPKHANRGTAHAQRSHTPNFGLVAKKETGWVGGWVLVVGAGGGGCWWWRWWWR